MDFMKSIRSKLSARQADAQENYCSAISEIATGKMSDRAAIEAVDALVELLPQTGKTADDIETDIELLRTLKSTEERAADLADAEHAAKEAAVAAGRVLEEAEELRQQADAMVRDADERRSLAASKVHAARAARSEAHSIRRQLAARGWPGPQAAPAVEVPQ
jgi:hypothetical protein